MPYKVNDPKLPANVKKLLPKQQRAWVHIWNSTYQDCTAGGGDAKTCESKAFRVANGVLKKGRVMGIRDTIKAVFRPEPAKVTPVQTRQADHFVRLNTRSVIQRVDGKQRLFSISAVAARNRVGEIDSRSLFDSMVSISRATGRYPQRDFMHYGMRHPAFVTGNVVFMARDGNCLVTVTEFNDSELARAEIEARSTEPDKWGDSIAYILLDEPEVLREGSDEDDTLVLNFGYCKFVSTVPERIAASHFTRGSLEEPDMQEHDFEILAELMRDPEKARRWLEENVGDVERAIAEAGLMTRAAEDVEEEIEAEEVERVEPTEVEEPAVENLPFTDMEFEVDEGLMAELANRAGRSLQARFDELEAGLAGVLEKLDALSVRSAEQFTGYEERLAVLERSEQEKIDEIKRDMPRKAQLVVTHRPREADNGKDVQPTFAERAAEGTRKWKIAQYQDE